mmetsp:Transcript_1402/g.2448  ORF Transcript_1402/g.2448 Transcript_1402/m.2448 type:complete len:108 (-) Transcript_1402:60-383(-)
MPLGSNWVNLFLAGPGSLHFSECIDEPLLALSSTQRTDVLGFIHIVQGTPQLVVNQSLGNLSTQSVEDKNANQSDRKPGGASEELFYSSDSQGSENEGGSDEYEFQW